MFDELRAAFREALENFNKELSRNQVPETVDKLLVGMKNEIVDEKAQVSGLESQLEKTRAEIERVQEQARTARRREAMARKIDDQETVTLAGEYAGRQEGHVAVLQKKAAALQEELDFRRRTLEEMYARFNEAKEKRDALSAKAGRSGARDSISAADDLFGELDRMADKIDGEHAKGEAAQSFSELDLGGDDSEYRVDLDEPPPREELDVDAALAELKRRMGRS